MQQSAQLKMTSVEVAERPVVVATISPAPVAAQATAILAKPALDTPPFKRPARSVTADPRRSIRPRRDRVPLGQILLEIGAVQPGDMLKALALRQRQDVRLGDILLTHGWVSEADLMAALAKQSHAAVIDLLAEPPDPRLIDTLGPELCLKEAMVPWRRIGGITLIATARRLLLDPVEVGPIRLLGVGFSGLSDVLQESLFPELEQQEAELGDTRLPGPPPEPQSGGWRVGDDVRHPDHGHGWVQGAGHGVMTVRTLALDIEFSRFKGFSLYQLFFHGGLTSGDTFERWLDDLRVLRERVDLAGA